MHSIKLTYIICYICNPYRRYSYDNIQTEPHTRELPTQFKIIPFFFFCHGILWFFVFFFNQRLQLNTKSTRVYIIQTSIHSKTYWLFCNFLLLCSLFFCNFISNCSLSFSAIFLLLLMRREDGFGVELLVFFYDKRNPSQSSKVHFDSTNPIKSTT